MRLDFTPDTAPHLGYPAHYGYPGYAHPSIIRGALNGLSNVTAAKIIGAGNTGAATGIATGSIVAGSISAGLMTAAMFTGPVVGAILASAAGLVSVVAQFFRGCGQSCTAATRIVDQVESQHLKPNLEQWRGLPLKTQSVQAAYLSYFDQAWASVRNGCGNPALGAAGQRCISERQRGGSASWCPTGTGCDWFALYRDPIANDPNVVPDNASPISIDAVNNTATFQTVSGGTVTIPVAAAIIAEQQRASASAATGAEPGVTILSSVPVPLLLGGALVVVALSLGGGK